MILEIIFSHTQTQGLKSSFCKRCRRREKMSWSVASACAHLAGGGRVAHGCCVLPVQFGRVVIQVQSLDGHHHPGHLAGIVWKSRDREKKFRVRRARGARGASTLQEYARCNKHQCPAMTQRLHLHSIKPVQLSLQARSSIPSLRPPKNFSSSQITLESAQLAKYTVVHLVSFGLCYSSQPPSWSTADASIAEEFFHIKVFRS